ncbi:MAG: hypothetical protein KJ601_07375 [Nanoarchaeota archaeon]|nr:hypothetical protein [Nanoarchaeota archaeon]
MIESSLLYTRENGNQGFVHDSYGDFFIAKYLAAEINQNRMDVHDTCLVTAPVIPTLVDIIDEYGIDRVELLENWRKVWDITAYFLAPDKARGLVDVVWGQFERGSRLTTCTDEQYRSYFVYTKFCLELIEGSQKFDNIPDSHGSYYLIIWNSSFHDLSLPSYGLPF